MSDLVWDRGLLVKKSIDPVRMAELYFGVDPWRLLVVGTSKQGAVELRPGDTMDRPTAVHPVWEYGEDLILLEEAMQHEKFIVVTQLPSMVHPIGRQFVRTLHDLQEENPDCILHIHGLYSWRLLFGLSFKSVDIEPRSPAAKGHVMIPPGRELSFERAAEMPHWVNLLGMHTADLKIPRNRCMYNIRSARWAAEHFKSTVKFRANRSIEIDPRAYTDPNFKPQPSKRIFLTLREAMPGDKLACDVCSLKATCRYFRDGSVCAVPDTDGAELARLFKTRDSDSIIDGLGTLLAAQSQRLEKGLEDEELAGGLSKEVTKIINTLFDRGVKLARLLDPSLDRPTTKVSVNFNRAQITASTPQALMASAVKVLEDRGIKREAITTEMIEELLGEPEALKMKAIGVAETAAM